MSIFLDLSTWLSALHQSGVGMSGLPWTSRSGRKSPPIVVARLAVSLQLELVTAQRWYHYGSLKRSRNRWGTLDDHASPMCSAEGLYALFQPFFLAGLEEEVNHAWTQVRPGSWRYILERFARRVGFRRNGLAAAGPWSHGYAHPREPSRPLGRGSWTRLPQWWSAKSAGRNPIAHSAQLGDMSPNACSTYHPPGQAGGWIKSGMWQRRGPYNGVMDLVYAASAAKYEYQARPVSQPSSAAGQAEGSSDAWEAGWDSWSWEEWGPGWAGSQRAPKAEIAPKTGGGLAAKASGSEVKPPGQLKRNLKLARPKHWRRDLHKSRLSKRRKQAEQLLLLQLLQQETVRRP
eukprot:3481399-Amphidinium_carterae.1